ncbi:MAG: peptidylprolyl isomerase [Candidatus Omnitrophota bacterium]|nr:peptidylprolyl isomerase [Candidatus Omnitrophota bacterium]
MRKLFIVTGVLFFLEFSVVLPGRQAASAKDGLSSEALAEKGISAKEGDIAEVDKIVAVVGDEVITNSELATVLFSVYGEYKKKYSGGELAQKMDQVRRSVLSQMIEEKLILNAAEETDIEVTGQEIDEKIEALKKRFNSEKDFISALKKQGTSLRDLKKRFKREILKSKLIDQKVKMGITVSLKEIDDYYRSNPDEFIKPEMARIGSILVKPAGGQPGDWDSALAEMHRILSELNDGADFKELAKKFSQGLNAENGGGMGVIGRGQMLKEIDQAIFSLEPGEVSPPIKTKSGYCIFKLEAKHPGSVVEFENAQNTIKSIVFTEKFKIKFKKWIEGLKKDAYISIK